MPHLYHRRSIPVVVCSQMGTLRLQPIWEFRAHILCRNLHDNEIPSLGVQKPCTWTGDCPVEGCEEQCLVNNLFAADNFKLYTKVEQKIEAAFMCPELTVLVKQLQIFSDGSYYDYYYDSDAVEYEYGVAPAGDNLFPTKVCHHVNVLEMHALHCVAVNMVFAWFIMLLSVLYVTEPCGGIGTSRRSRN